MSLHNGPQSDDGVDWSGAALLLIDIQDDFVSGSLAVPTAEEIFRPLKKLIESLPSSRLGPPLTVLTQDYHPAGHVSFASSHAGAKPFTSIEIPHPNLAGKTVEQALWPDHCVASTSGANIDARIIASLQGQQYTILQKGTKKDVDCYSGFASNDYVSFTDLPRLLFASPPLSDEDGRPKRPIDTVVVAGLATDFCVRATAIDARKFHLRTIVLSDCVRGVHDNSTAMEQMQQFGVEFIESTKLAECLSRRA